MNGDELRDVEVADVVKAGVRAGALRREGTDVVFSYDRDYLASSRPAVATTLPLSEDEVVSPGGAVPAFFAGLLPEGRRLSVLWRALKTSPDDELSLLLAVGTDTVGDVQVVPVGSVPSPAEPAVTVTRWDEVRFSALLARSIGEPGEIDPVGIPGVQAKLSGRVVSLPVAERDARWILKLTPPEYPHLVENEAFFLDAAARCGLPVAEARVVHDADGASGLLVRRFDRQVTEEGVIALAQEDACQVLGLHPAAKYRLGAEEVVAALVACTRARPVARRDLFRQLVFAYLTGDGDVHAKNLSVGQTGDGEWRITPVYDVPSTRPYGDTRLALSMGGRRDGLSRQAVLGFADAIQLAPRAAARVLDDLCGGADEWIARLPELPFDEGRVRDLARLARRRQRELSQG